jgi:xanthine dehydrogenase large subunit
MAKDFENSGDGGIRHLSADKHVSGKAIYADDIPEPQELLHLYIAMSAHAHARLISVDLGAVRSARDVVWVGCADDIPGANNVGPVVADEPLFAASETSGGDVQTAGQALFAVAATSPEAARRAAKLAKIIYDPRDPILTIDQAMDAKSFFGKPKRISRGDATAVMAAARHRLTGTIEIGGQDHFYLEGQVAVATPGEDDEMHVVSSNQHPSECQQIVAHVLDIPANAVTVEVKRLGGGFGGKETQANLMAAAAALAARATECPVKIRLDRDQDMILTGKRHDFQIDWDVGFDDDGRIEGVSFVQKARCGWSTDLSHAICDRAMFHADNCYFLPAVDITSYRCRTNTVSGTAFRGFGAPQGMMGIERVIDRIAHHLDLDPLEVRQANLYDHPSAIEDRCTTPFEMKVEDFIVASLLDQVARTSDYRARRRAIAEWNSRSPLLKKGIALTPVKFGVSFTTTHLNQAGALVHVYRDGSVLVTHGGVEMGQGLHTKIASIAAHELQLDLDRIRVSSTRTDKIPNTSATAASAGTDLNGMAVKAACAGLRSRLTRFLADDTDIDVSEVEFLPNRVRYGADEISFADLVEKAYIAREPLFATGFYATPQIHWDPETGRGRPFYYFAYGAAVTEVLIDTLTGENRMMRVDALLDAGRSLNPDIDLGQLEGGFLQGAGWLTTEELWWDDHGHLKTHAPSTYKIPCASDRPPVMNLKLWDKGINREPTIGRSKGIGEPPFMLAMSVHHAISHAIGSCGDGGYPDLDTPATPERILAAITKLRK